MKIMDILLYLALSVVVANIAAIMVTFAQILMDKEEDPEDDDE